MPRTVRSPPPPSRPQQAITETQSEPDLSAVVSEPESSVFDSINVTTRPLKRMRGEGRYPESDKFEELKEMLQSWKAQQDIILNKLVEEISEVKQQNLAIKKSNDEIEKSMLFLNENYEDMRTRLVTLERDWKTYEERFRGITSGSGPQTVARLEAKIDSMEQFARQCNIEICNLPDKRNENLVTIIESIGNVVNFPVSHNDIISAHRVPHAQQQDSKPKNVVVKLRSRIVRDNLLSAYRKIKSIKSDQLGISGAPVKVYMNEHLTLKNKALFRKCREVASKNHFKFVWIKNATILVREREGMRATAILTDDDLKKIVCSEKIPPENII